MTQSRDVLVTGGTGYIGRRLVPTLIARGHQVRVLARRESGNRVPAGAAAVIGDALDADSIASALRSGDTLVHLVGTPHPNPSKAQEFERVDLASVRASVAAARRVDVSHLVYVSVAQPAPIMHAYVAVRAEGEKTIADANLTATVLRPWYVLGPGHRWPLVLVPLYASHRSFRRGAPMPRALVWSRSRKWWPPSRVRSRILRLPGRSASSTCLRSAGPEHARSSVRSDTRS